MSVEIEIVHKFDGPATALLESLATALLTRSTTVKEAIDLYGSMYPNRRRSGELIELVGLQEKTDARIKTLSGGQRRRLELALGIVGDPELIFLDEPTTGFDPSARRQAWSIVENLTSLGKTVLSLEPGMRQRS